MELLAPRYRVVAIDSYGAGKSPEWPSSTEISLADEVALAEPLLAGRRRCTGGPFVWRRRRLARGAAASGALRQPGAVRTDAVRAGRQAAPGPQRHRGHQGAVMAAAACLERGDTDGAGRSFIDFWMGPGNWDRMPAERRAPLAASTTNIRRWAHALVTDPVKPDDLRTLRMPVLLLTGAASPESAHAVIRALQGLLPNATTIELPGLGHMAPVSHPQPVNAAIATFLDRVSAPAGGAR
jgi:pimeloyl-ACP methyl ester carboxylesterase